MITTKVKAFPGFAKRTDVDAGESLYIFVLMLEEFGVIDYSFIFYGLLTNTHYDIQNRVGRYEKKS